jgi:hypothetical protein
MVLSMYGSCTFNDHKKTCANSLQGNCTSGPVPVDLGLSGPGYLVSRTPQQCLLVTDIRFLRAEQNLWLDNIYIRYKASNRTRESSLVDCIGGSCNLWLTSVTLQGYKVPHSDQEHVWNGAVAVVGGQLYAEGAGFRFYVHTNWGLLMTTANEILRICACSVG